MKWKDLNRSKIESAINKIDKTSLVSTTCSSISKNRTPSATSSTLTITSTHEESKKEDNRKDNRGSVMRRSYSLLTGKAILNNFGNTKFIMHD